jgi:hypothetical protein
MEIKALKNEVFKFFGEQAQEVWESDGYKLLALPTQDSLDFKDQFTKSIYALVAKDTSNNEELLQMQRLISKTGEIARKYENHIVLVKKVAARTKAQSSHLVTDEELAQEVRELITPQITPDLFQKDEDYLYQNLIQTVCTNTAIMSGLFTDGAVINIKELEAQNERLAHHAKKTAFDQVCLLVFGQTVTNYDKMRLVEEMDSNHQINNLMEIKVKKNQILHGYVDLNPLTIPKFPRFAALMSERKGVAGSVEEVVHQFQELVVEVVIAGENVKVKVPVWYGAIVARMEGDFPKSLSLESLLVETEQLVKNNKSLASVVSKLAEEPNLIGGYFKVFEALASATSENYGLLKQKFKQAGLVNASR